MQMTSGAGQVSSDLSLDSDALRKAPRGAVGSALCFSLWRHLLPSALWYSKVESTLRGAAGRSNPDPSPHQIPVVKVNVRENAVPLLVPVTVTW